MLEVIHTPTLTSILGFSFFYGDFMAELTQERLKELLNYDAETGLFTWINNSPTGGKVKAGNIAGTNKLGYVAIGIGFKHYSAHRLVWLYCFGRFPSKCIDHINHDRKDNRHF